MKRSRTVSPALVGLLVWVTACTTWKQIEPGEAGGFDRVRVSTLDGEVRDVVGTSERRIRHARVKHAEEVRRLVQRQTAGVGVNVTPHTFRRSCTTELIRGGANLYHVKELLATRPWRRSNTTRS